MGAGPSSLDPRRGLCNAQPDGVGELCPAPARRPRLMRNGPLHRTSRRRGARGRNPQYVAAGSSEPDPLGANRDGHRSGAPSLDELCCQVRRAGDRSAAHCRASAALGVTRRSRDGRRTARVRVPDHGHPCGQGECLPQRRHAAGPGAIAGDEDGVASCSASIACRGSGPPGGRAALVEPGRPGPRSGSRTSSGSLPRARRRRPTPAASRPARTRSRCRRPPRRGDERTATSAPATGTRRAALPARRPTRSSTTRRRVRTQPLSSRRPPGRGGRRRRPTGSPGSRRPPYGRAPRAWTAPRTLSMAAQSAWMMTRWILHGGRGRPARRWRCPPSQRAGSGPVRSAPRRSARRRGPAWRRAARCCSCRSSTRG